MEEYTIQVNNLTKVFTKQIRQKGLLGMIKSLFSTKKVKLTAVNNISFSIKKGEMVAYIGANGAGKSTTIKMMTGILTPTSGEVLIDGLKPYDSKKRKEVLKKIGVVFGQRTQLWWDLPLLETYYLLKDIYEISDEDFNERFTYLRKTLELEKFIQSPVRTLSLGQRMRADLAASLIHNPEILFLDEPTSGLDPGTERSIMKTLKTMSEMGKTIILVTHNTLNLHLCDKIAFFGEGGKLCFFGSPNDALEFFNVTDFVDIYNIINEDVDAWKTKFDNSVYAQNMTEIEAKPSTNKVINKKKSFFKQLSILIARYIKLISNDIQQMMLLFAQAPLIAMLLSLVTTDQLYKGYDDTKAILFSLGCSSIWLGLLNAIQEICKEKVILQKEHMADLKLSAYLFSKIIVQGILAFLQATCLVFIFQKMSGQAETSILINPFWDMQIICLQR